MQVPHVQAAGQVAEGVKADASRGGSDHALAGQHRVSPDLLGPLALVGPQRALPIGVIGGAVVLVRPLQ